MLKLGSSFLNGKYTVESKLGHGSFGIVYKALEKFSQKYVAIKEITDDDYKEALLAEIALMSGLHHPHVVQYKTTEEVDENLYLVMEYLSGGSLGTVVGKGKTVSSATAKQYLMDILEGLKYLHAHDVVHRDLKPDNVLISEDGSVKIVDFGVSRALTKSRKAASKTGTIFYMAPEMFEEDGYDHRIDLYSVGCLYFEMLTGESPFTGGEAKVMMGHVAHDPVYPVSLSEEELLILKGLLAKDAKNRFANAEAVLSALAGETAASEPAFQAEDIYRQAVTKALADGVIDETERSMLNSLKGSFGLLRETCDAIEAEEQLGGGTVIATPDMFKKKEPEPVAKDEDSEPSTSTIEGVAQAEVSEEKKLVEPQSEELKSHKDLTHIDLRKTKVNSESIVSEPDMSLSNIVRGGVAILLSLIAIIYGAVGAGQGVSEVAFFGFGLFVFSISLFFYKKGWWIRVTGAIGLAVAMMAVLI